MKENILFIIPARANSIRFPKKNFFKIKGKTLLHHKIINCKRSKLGKILITSDDPEILEKANDLNVDFIRKRPKNLEGDGPTTPIVYDALKYYERLTNKKVDIIILTQVTTPFIFSDHFIEATNFFINNKRYKSLVSCSLDEKKYLWSIYEDDKEKTYDLPSNLSNRIEDFFQNKKGYIPNGGIYIIRRKALKSSGVIYSEPLKVWKMNKIESIDIDYIEDGIIAKALARIML